MLIKILNPVKETTFCILILTFIISEDLTAIVILVYIIIWAKSIDVRSYVTPQVCKINREYLS